jgi:hypothetical protein
MPTFETLPQFEAGWKNLSREQQARFRDVVREALAQKHAVPHSAPAAREVAGHPGIFEMSWSPAGRATFSFGAERVPGHRHVVWRQIGTIAGDQ